jgi:hypothetical protein
VLRLKRSLLVTAASVLAACSDLDMRRSTETAVVDTVSVPQSLARQPSRPRSQKVRRNRGGNDEAASADVQRTLRQLVAREETFFSENGTYTDDLSVIRFTPEKNVAVRFLWLSRDGWAARGTHSDLPDKDCVIFVGRAQAPPTTLKYARAGRLGVPVCDDRSAPPEPVAAAPRPSAPTPSPADTANALDLLDPRVVMKVDLRNLAHSQQTYFAMQGIYARRPETMALQYLWHRDVRVQILDADAQSWAAKATHTRHPGKSCVIWVGNLRQRPRTDAQQRSGDRSGVPVCDD